MKKIAICVLSRGYNDINQYRSLIERNISLENSLHNEKIKNYSFIILHEGNIDEDHQTFISSKTPNLKIEFWDIKTKTPNNAFDNNKNIVNEFCPPNWLTNNFPIGYKHMCHFWSIDFLDYLKDFDYVIRIDEDCVVENFNMSIIDEMEDENLLFVSPMFQEQDVDLVIVGLDNLRNEYIKENDLHNTTEFNKIMCPYTNFMVVNVKEINNNLKVKKFLNKVDSCGCIYSNRWGDLPIWGVILDTILDKNQYKEVKTIKYFHGSHNQKIN
jgi:hypothetical protein